MKIIYYEYVKDYFEEQKCELLDEIYISAKTLMKYKCVCGNISKICWSNFKNGKRCKLCKIDKVTAHTRHTYEFVYNYFKTNNCELLENNYINSLTPMRYKCVCDNISKISLGNFQQGKRCKNCAIKRISGSNHYLWNTNREKIKDNLIFRKRCYGVLYFAMKSLGLKKNDRYNKVVGYTSRELKRYIISHPNWNQVKDGKWEIDHVFPIKAFLDFGITDIKLVNSMGNLQPVLQSINRRKSKKYNKKEFTEWLANKGAV